MHARGHERKVGHGSVRVMQWDQRIDPDSYNGFDEQIEPRSPW